MKKLSEMINESKEWNPQFNNHKQAYNSFIKWYDKQINHMNKDELLDMLKYIISDIESDTLEPIK